MGKRECPNANGPGCNGNGQLMRPIVYESDTDNLRIEWNTKNTYSVFFGTKEIDSFYVYNPRPNMRDAVRNARLWVIANRWNGNV